jgi:hypothetical protein
MSGEYPAVQNGHGLPAERREVRIRVPSALQDGWLAFQAGMDRRRLAPIPGNWIELSDEQLVALLGSADRLIDGDNK